MRGYLDWILTVVQGWLNLQCNGKQQMCTVLVYHVEEKKSYTVKYITWIKDNKNAQIFMLGSIINSLAVEYEGQQTARKVMENLEKDFGDVSLIKVFSLVSRFLWFY